MNFNPKTEDQIAEDSLLPDGNYDFNVLSAEDMTSKSGNEMIKLKLLVLADLGEKIVFDYILEKMAFKLRHFCETTGLIEVYEKGNLDSMTCVGKSGVVVVGKSKDKTGKYPPKNVVVDYGGITKEKVNENTLNAEDLPF